jgi:hypothetical protein
MNRPLPRFGLFGFVALSLVAARLLAERDGRAAAWRALPPIAVYVVVRVALHAPLLYGANIALPDGTVLNLMTRKPF